MMTNGLLVFLSLIVLIILIVAIYISGIKWVMTTYSEKVLPANYMNRNRDMNRDMDEIARSHGVTIIDDFYKDPDTVRRMALSGTFETYPEPGSGLISSQAFDQIWPWVRNDLDIDTIFKDCDLGRANSLSGHFHMTPQGSNLGDSFVHKDTDKFNMIIYLNPHFDRDVECGTTLWRRKPEYEQLPWSKESSFDQAEWEKVCDIPMKYNRLVLFDGNMWHSRGNFSDLGLWGTNKDNSRLVQVFWFERKESKRTKVLTS